VFVAVIASFWISAPVLETMRTGIPEEPTSGTAPTKRSVSAEMPPEQLAHTFRRLAQSMRPPVLVPSTTWNQPNCEPRLRSPLQLVGRRVWMAQSTHRLTHAPSDLQFPSRTSKRVPGVIWVFGTSTAPESPDRTDTFCVLGPT